MKNRTTSKYLAVAILGIAISLLATLFLRKQPSAPSALQSTAQRKITVPRTHDCFLKIPKEELIAAAVNQLETQSDNSVQLRHPLYDVNYSAEGIAFSPRQSSGAWRWSLDGATAVTPMSDENRNIHYRRDGFVEQYLTGHDSIEQRFIYESPPSLDPGDDLVGNQD